MYLQTHLIKKVIYEMAKSCFLHYLLMSSTTLVTKLLQEEWCFDFFEMLKKIESYVTQLAAGQIRDNEPSFKHLKGIKTLSLS